MYVCTTGYVIFMYIIYLESCIQVNSLGRQREEEEEEEEEEE